MEEDEAPVAAGDLLEPLLECVDLPRGLGVHLAEQRLAEVGDLGAGEAADEALRPGDPDLDARRARARGGRARGRRCRPPGALRSRRPGGRRGDRGCRAPPRPAAGRRPGRHRRARLPAPACRGSSGRRRAARDRALGSSANECVMRSRCSSDAWRSPAAATRITGTTGRAYPVGAGRSTTASPRFREAQPRVSPRDMSHTPAETFPALIETMKKAAAALDAAGVPVLLGGGLAAWARGGPTTDHDVDFLLREETPSAASRRSRMPGCSSSALRRGGSTRRGTATRSSTSSSDRRVVRSTTRCSRGRPRST